MKKKWLKWLAWCMGIAAALYLGLWVYNLIRLPSTLKQMEERMRPQRSLSEAAREQMWKSRFASADYQDRRALVQSAMKQHDLSAVPALQDCLKSDDIWLRIHASEALYALGDRSSYETLVQLLDFNDVKALKRGKPEGFREAVGEDILPEDRARADRDELRAIRISAAIFLANNKEERALPALLKMFKEQPHQGLAEALATFQTKEIADMIYEQMLKTPYQPGYAEGLLKMKDERAIPILLQNFQDGLKRRQNDPRGWDGSNIMESSALLLLRFGRTDHLDYLIERIKKGDRDMAYQIAKIGTKEAAPAFLEILSTSSDPATIYSMGICLAKLGRNTDPQAAQALIAAIERCPQDQRRATSSVLIAYPQPEAQAVFSKYNPEYTRNPQNDPSLKMRVNDYQTRGIDALMPE